MPTDPAPLFGRTKLLLLLSLPVAWLVVRGLSFFPDFVERVYSRGLGRRWFQGLSLATGWTSLPLGQILTGVAIAATLGFGGWAAIRVIRSTSGRGRLLARYAINTLALVSATTTVVLIPYSLNFARHPFQVIARLDVHPSSAAELRAVTMAMAGQASTLRATLNEDAGGVMKLSGGRDNVFLTAATGYDNLAKIHPMLGGRYGRPKAMLVPGLMARFYVAGIFCPATGEANVCTITVDAYLPAITCHEMAHQRGFAREDEASYLAYLACRQHPNPDFQYSGTVLALEALLRALRGVDPEGHAAALKAAGAGVRRDFDAAVKAYAPYAGRLAQVSRSVNDSFLKANRQVDGVFSYGRIVDLLLAEARRKP